MRRRQGFTLVELMVSMALIIFIMAILSQAFVSGLKSFQQLKAAGDMDEKLRGIATVLRSDLAADHFEGRKRLSDANFWSASDGLRGHPPREGFFRIWQGSVPWTVGASVPWKPSDPLGTTSRPMGTLPSSFMPIGPGPNQYEGSDPGFGGPSYRSTDHMLHFTVRLRGNDRSKFFTAAIPSLTSPLTAYPLPDTRFQGTAGTTFNSPLAEVVYFMRPNGRAAGNSPLYNLYRRVLLVVPDNTAVNGQLLFVNTTPPNAAPYPAIPGAEAAAIASYAEYSCHPSIPTSTLYPTGHTDLYFNNMSDLTVPLHRFGMAHDPTFVGNPLYAYAGVPAAPPPPGTGGRPRPYTYPYPNSPAGEAIQVYTYPLIGEPGTPTESELLMTDVISFDVRMQTPQSVARAAVDARYDPFVDLYDSQAYYVNVLQQAQQAQPLLGNLNSSNLFFTDQIFPGQQLGPLVGGQFPAANELPVGQNPRCFDTWTNYVANVLGTINYTNWATPPVLPPSPSQAQILQYQQQSLSNLPVQLQINALQVTLRVWDSRSLQTRQVTILQDM